ncbi:MAG: hypothetical protein Kow0080_36840 [Candidatus Promineifilaceae bacterium]
MNKQQNTNSSFKSDVKHLTWPLRLFVAAMDGLDQLMPQVTSRLMLAKFVAPRRKKNGRYTSRLPAGAARLAAQHNNLTLTGWCWDGDGPAVLVVHGWESHTGRMVPLIKALLAHGCRIFALDAPGHGMSPQANTHLQDVGEAIRAMIEQHGPFHGIVAHSFGAAATAVMLSRHPELMPDKLVFLSPMRDLAQHLDIFAAVAQLTPARKERLQELVRQRLGLSFEDCSTVAAVRTFSRPGLVIHDQNDRLIPHAVGEEIARNWAGTRFVSTSHLGHRRGLSCQQVVSHITDYLADSVVRKTAVSRSIPAPSTSSRPRRSFGTAVTAMS